MVYLIEFGIVNVLLDNINMVALNESIDELWEILIAIYFDQTFELF